LLADASKPRSSRFIRQPDHGHPGELLVGQHEHLPVLVAVRDETVMPIETRPTARQSRAQSISLSWCEFGPVYRFLQPARGLLEVLERRL